MLNKVRAPTDCKQCVTLVSDCPQCFLIMLLVPTIALVVFWLCELTTVAGMAVAVVAMGTAYMSAFFWLPQWLFWGTRVYAWLDQEDRLHIHESSWWRDLASNKPEVKKRIPKSNVLSLWLGTWGGWSKVLGDNSLFWKVKVSGKWTFWPSPTRDLVFRDLTGCSVRIPLIKMTIAGAVWNWDYLTLAIQTMDRHQALRDVFLATRVDQSSVSTIAGKVGTA